jgi:ribosomal protein L35AE/L33A
MSDITVTVNEQNITVSPVVETVIAVTVGTGGSAGVSLLDELLDVTITNPQVGDVIKYNGTEYINAPDEIGDNLSLDSLSDVVITTPTLNQVLKFNGTSFVNATDEIGDNLSLDNLNDVVITTVQTNDILQFNGTSFVNAPIPPVETTRQYVANQSGATILKGSVVYVTGSQGQRVTVGLAKADSELTSSKTLGLTQSEILNNNNGYVITEGLLTDIDTSAATLEGDAVYLSPTVSGGFVYGVANHPSAPNHLVYIGVVVRKHASTGSILVKIQNGFELDEIHDLAIVTPQDKDIIQYDSATELWKNKVLSTYELFTENKTLISNNKIQLTYKPEGNLVLNMAMVYETNTFDAPADLYNNLTITYTNPNYFATFDGSITTVNGLYGVVSYLRRIN